MRQSHLSGVISDDGVDSPTYDGDVETSTNTTTTARLVNQQYLGSSRLSGSSTSTLTSPTSKTFPVTATTAAVSVPGGKNTPTVTVTTASRAGPATSSGLGQSVGAEAAPLTVTDEPAPAPQATAEFDPARLTTEDIRKFVKQAIAGDVTRPYKINQPPVGRPVRIYADGMQTDCFSAPHSNSIP